MEPSTSTASCPVLFHPYHGENIELLEQRQRALRRVSFEKGLVFSDRPLQENEYFFISIETVEGGWSGHLRIGLTTLNPDSHPTSSQLESSSWLVSVSPFLVPLSSQEPLPTEKGSLIGVYFERLTGNTRVHIVMNSFDMCPEVEGVPSDVPLFAVVDVFGSTKEVRVVQPPPGREPARLAAICTRHVNKLIDQGRCTHRNVPAPLWQRLQKT